MKFYQGLAKHYDQIYSQVDYPAQVNFFAKAISQYKKTDNNRILDVACGTGTHADLLQKRGFEVVGVDQSEAMLEQARKKNSDIQWHQAEMQDINLDQKFGAAICFFSSILYNRNLAEFSKTLVNFNKHLEIGGLLIFDAGDKSIGINSKKERYVTEKDGNKIVFAPQWIYNEQKDVLEIDIDFEVNGRRLKDLHIMGAFTDYEIRKMLEQNGFEIVFKKQKHLVFKSSTESKNYVYITRKVRELEV